MPLEGTPDFSQPLVEDGMTLFYPFQSGVFTLCPEGLDIAKSAGGRPAFSLELVQGSSSYGVLDFTLAASFRMEDALKLVRAKRAAAGLQRSQFTGAFFRWRPRLESEMPPGFLEPQALAWNGLGMHRFILKLSKDAAVLMRHALADETFILDATVDVEMEGIAPRVPVRVKFNSSELLKALRRSGLLLPQSEVVQFFRGDVRNLPLAMEGSLAEELRTDFAEAITDRIRARFGRFAAAPPEDPSPHFGLPSETENASGEFNWDLSQPVLVKRAFTLRMHPLGLVRDFIRQSGIEAFCRETVVPPLPTGQYSVSLLFNLSQGRPVNIAAAGATLQVPPAPPYRFQAATVTAEVRPPAFITSARLNLSPVEKLQYHCTTWAALSNTHGIARYEAEPFQGSDDLLNLGPAELPFRLIPVAADDSLLNVATIEGTLTCEDAQKPFEVRFTLDSQTTAADLAVPRKASKCQLLITAREKGGNGVLTLPLLTADAFQLGLYSFREYGPQRVTVTLPVADGQPSRVVEMLPEGQPESACQVLAFTSREPSRVCSWFADSPFHCGFRYRIRTTFGAPAGPWSDIRQPFEPLALT